MSYGCISLIDEVKKLEHNGQTLFVYYPPNRMRSLYACKVLSEHGYDPKIKKNEKGVLFIECDLNKHRYSYRQGEISQINIVFISSKNIHPFLNKKQIEILLKNPDLTYHILECDGRYLWLSHQGSKTLKGAQSKADKSLELINHTRQFKNVNKSLMQDVFKFIGVPIPQGST